MKLQDWKSVLSDVGWRLLESKSSVVIDLLKGEASSMAFTTDWEIIGWLLKTSLLLLKDEDELIFYI
jgi:hypothetical protein